METEKLRRRSEQIKEDIEFFERKANKILYEAFSKSSWYPECHNDPNKKICDHCLNCWPITCDRHNCDRVGRCLCPSTECICLGR